MIGKVAWSYAERALHRNERARRNRALITGAIFATGAVGAGLAWYFRFPLIAFVRDLLGLNVSHHYGEPVPLSRKKQRAIERREAAAKRAHEPHPPAALRVEKNAKTELAVPLGQLIKH